MHARSSGRQAAAEAGSAGRELPPARGARELAAESVGTPALPAARLRALHHLDGHSGRDRDPLRVQRRPLAYDAAGALAAVVHRGRDRERPPRPGAAVGAQAHPVPRRRLRRDRRAPRCRARARAPALARPRQRGREHDDAPAARDPRAGHGRGAAPALPPDLQLHQPRDVGAGDRSGDLRDLLRRRHRPGATRHDRAGLRGGGCGSRRAGARPALPRARAAARARHPRQRGRLLRRVDRRLRHHPVPRGRG